MAESDDAGEVDAPEEADEPRRERGGSRLTRGLREQLTGLLDPEGAIRKGQGLVTGVTQATKEEIMRIVTAEVRSFLEKIDAVDLLQQVVAGLVVDVNMQVKFSRENGKTPQPEVTRSDTEIRVRDDADADADTDDEDSEPA